MPLLQAAPLRAPGVLPLLTPEQIGEESTSLLGAGLSGLSWVGDALDTATGARAIRAALHGLSGGDVNPLEILTFGPFGTVTDALGLTSREGIVQPGELAVQWGMEENKPGLDWADARDLGLGILFDPATYLTGGLSAAGKAAKAAGVFPKAIRTAEGALTQGVRSQALTTTLDDILRGAGPDVAARIEQAAGGAEKLAGMANDPLRSGIFGVKIPFQKYMGLGDDPLVSFGGENLGGAMDTFFDRLRYGAVPGEEATSIGGRALDAVGAGVRNLAPLVSKPLRDITTRKGQVAAAKNWDDFQGKLAIGRKELADEAVTAMRFGLLEVPNFSDIVSTGMELSPEQVIKRLSAAGLNDEQVGTAVGMIGRMRDKAANLAKEEQGAWLKTDILDDPLMENVGRQGQRMPDREFVAADGKELRMLPIKDVLNLWKENSINFVERGGANEIDNRIDDFGNWFNSTEEAVKAPELVVESGGKLGFRDGRHRLAWLVEQGYTDVPFQAPAKEWKEIEKLLPDVPTQKMGYAPRQPTLPRSAKRSTNNVYNARHAFQGPRADDVRGITKETLNKISVDPVVSGKARTAADYKDAAAHIQATYNVDAAKAKELARWARKLDPIHVETGSPAYANDIFVDMEKRYQAGMEAAAAGNTVKGLLQDLASEAGDVKVSDVLNKAGMSVERAAAEMGDDWLSLRVDRSTADEIARVMKPFTQPEVVSKLVDLIIDRPTNFFRSTVTAPFPAFHSRNYVSGQFMNYVIGGLSWNSMKGAWNLVRGKEIKGASEFPMFAGKGLTDAQATDEIRKLLYAHNVMGPGQGRDLASTVEGVAGSNVLDNIPGLTPATGPLAALKKAIPRSRAQAMPWNTAGVATEGDVFSPVVAGREFGETVEGLNRGTPFIEFLRKGMDPTEAAARVKAAHVDYSSLTQFERRFARRIMPFYSFMSRMIPWTLRNLIDEPAGFVRQTARAANIMGGEDQGLLPAHIQSRFTIPIGQEDAEGNQKYFQGIDLPWESTFDLFRGGPTTFGTVKNTVGGLIGQMNPLLRAPIEIGSGYDFFSGRRLEDVDSTLGRIGSNITGREEPYYVDPLIEKSLQGVGGGLNRLLTMGRQLGDDRKTWTDLGLNFLTGAKITDQPLDRQRSIAARELISDSLRGQPGARTFEHLYVPQDRLELLSPENQRKYLLYRSLAAEAQRKAREKKAESN